MIAVATITSKGQLTLPKKVRDYLHTGTGDTVIFELVEDRLIIRKAKSVEFFFNSLPPLEKSLKNLDKKIAAEIWKNKNK